MARRKHEVVSAALGYIRCSCSWEYRVKNYKGKSDEDLAIEVGSEFEEHRIAMS